MHNLGEEVIAILDFGSQYTQLIARRIREAKVYCKIFPFDVEVDAIKTAKGIILSGGPASVYEDNAPIASPEILKLGIPILGICYGLQWIVFTEGGEVIPSKKREYGRTEMMVINYEDLFSSLPERIHVWMSHGDQIKKLPQGFEIIASSPNSPIAAIRDKRRKIYGLQFHPEVVHTPLGQDIINNFLYQISACSSNWVMGSFIEETLNEIKKTVGNSKVICGLSGGVDSSTAAVLVHKAIGDQLICIFVDNGLLRAYEREHVVKTFKDHFHINLIVVDAGERFLERLKGIEDPEKKRKIIGKEFISVFDETAEGIGDVGFLVQGTLYPDVIESRSTRGPSAIIKTHHNVGGLPATLPFKLIEPFKELFKDEVRLVGAELGLPDDIIWQHPFPGPGLAVRIIGEITRERLEILKAADQIITEEIKIYGLYKDLWQAFGVFLPVKSVGVMGDERTYEYVIALRVITSFDGMTADWARLPYELLGRIGNRIVEEVSGVNRVVYDITSKPPGTIEWE